MKRLLRVYEPVPMAMILLLCGTLTASAWLLADNHRTLVTRQATLAAEQAARFHTAGCSGCANHTLKTAAPTACSTGCGTGCGIRCANKMQKGAAQ